VEKTRAQERRRPKPLLRTSSATGNTADANTSVQPAQRAFDFGSGKCFFTAARDDILGRSKKKKKQSSPTPLGGGERDRGGNQPCAQACEVASSILVVSPRRIARRIRSVSFHEQARGHYPAPLVALVAGDAPTATRGALPKQRWPGRRGSRLAVIQAPGACLGHRPRLRSAARRSALRRRLMPRIDACPNAKPRLAETRPQPRREIQTTSPDITPR